MPVPTLLDLAKLDAGIGYPIIEEAVKLAPELQVVPADTIAGTTMELTVRTGLPSVSFRNANEGVARSKSSYETRTFQTHILDHQIAVDSQIVDGARDKGRLSGKPHGWRDGSGHAVHRLAVLLWHRQ